MPDLGIYFHFAKGYVHSEREIIGESRCVWGGCPRP